MISIVVPVYNMQEYLPDCLDSIVNQTIKPYEVVIVDDGSTDKSLEIAYKYAQENGWTIISQVNKGLSSARNTGIMNTKIPNHHRILFIDADDMLMENAIEEITLWDRFAFGAQIIAPSLKCFGLSNEEVILMQDPTLEDFRVGNRVGSCICIKKQLLLAVGGYSPKMVHGYEDLHLIINLLSMGCKICTIPKVLWLYRVKENSMITSAQEHHDELLAQIDKDFPEAKLEFPCVR